MVKKTALRQDFLHPDTEEDDNANEICRGLQSDAEDGVPVRAELPFNSQTLAQLSPLQFEAAVGALFIAEGYLVVLTARSGDGGADVIAASKGALVLVQAKHSRSNIPIDEAAIGDVVGALDIYGRELAADCDAMIVTNAAVSQAAVAEARRFGIELLSGNRLVERLREAGVGLSAMAACEARRCRTFAEGLVRAKLIVPQINQ